MSVCPFCKAPVAMPQAPCPRCGKLAAEHPSIAGVGGRTLGSEFDDDEDATPDLEIESGSSARGPGGAGGQHAGISYDSGKGVTLDDDLFGDDEPSGPLELDVPLERQAAAPPPAAPPVAAPASSPRPAPAAAPPSQAATAQDQAARRIANFPPPPQKLWEAPRYALRVLWRRFELGQDLTSLRKRRSPDVALYERALATHDPRMYAIGLAITGVAIFVATVLFFMPVIKRFAFAPE